MMKELDRETFHQGLKEDLSARRMLQNWQVYPDPLYPVRLLQEPAFPT